MKRSSLSVGLIAMSMAFMVSCREEKAATPTQSEVEANDNPKTTADVNPAHGQPGHRCDLPVGAPLNSSAAQQTQTRQTNNGSNSSSSTVSPIRVDQTPDVNPPHGEPYHDCSIPVGAPLKG